jgi:hypothetical protein
MYDVLVYLFENCQQAELAVDTSGLQFFDPESGLSIGHSALLKV